MRGYAMSANRCSYYCEGLEEDCQPDHHPGYVHAQYFAEVVSALTLGLNVHTATGLVVHTARIDHRSLAVTYKGFETDSRTYGRNDAPFFLIEDRPPTDDEITAAITSLTKGAP